jgi:sugar lactone lactonase YvrE
MDDDGKRPGKLFVYHPGGRCETAVDAVSIANTVSCSPDGRTFYLADSAEQLIYAYDLEVQTGALSNRRIFVDLRGTDAAPDGSAVDADGYLWNAQWGGWRIVRYAPDGSVDRIAPLPVQQPTSCAFGGPGLSTLYVTSARDGLSTEALAAQPLAGGLFAMETGVRGLALPLFG